MEERLPKDTSLVSRSTERARRSTNRLRVIGRAIVTASIVGTLFVAAASSAPGASPCVDFKCLKRAVVGIKTYDKFAQPTAEKFENFGSGFIVQPSGFILTNYHVVVDYVKDPKEYKIWVSLLDGDLHPKKPVESRIVFYDEWQDLALIKIPSGDELPHLSVGDSSPVSIPAALAVWGYRQKLADKIAEYGGQKLELSNTIGTWRGRYEVSGIIHPANSGAPIYDPKSFAVYGIALARVTVAGVPQGIGFVIPINYAARHLAMAGVGFERQEISALRELIAALDQHLKLAQSDQMQLKAETKNRDNEISGLIGDLVNLESQIDNETAKLDIRTAKVERLIDRLDKLLEYHDGWIVEIDSRGKHFVRNDEFPREFYENIRSVTIIQDVTDMLSKNKLLAPTFYSTYWGRQTRTSD